VRKADQGVTEVFDASEWRIGIVVAKFNSGITERLLSSALSRAEDYKIAKVDVLHVAGSIEIPLVLDHLARSGNYQALLAIGCVIRGETPHFDYVCKFVNEGILRVQLDRSMPIGFGVLTCNNMAQAEARAGLGGEHLDAVLQQARLFT
jgi:6,7-dimethyl-8-ribityllumazine synthase